MPVDNQIYNRPGDIWWDEHQPLNTIRTAINPARLEYFSRVLGDLGIDPAGKTVVDIGCGGGLFAEEFARLGAHVIGVDPSSSSLETARAHASASGLSLDYRQGTGEKLPLDDASVDIACCVDVLEHVNDLDAVLAETSRVPASQRCLSVRHDQSHWIEPIRNDQALSGVAAHGLDAGQPALVGTVHHAG